MNYQNKYSDFRAEVITQLRQALKEKGYNRQEQEDLPQEYIFDSSISEWYSIIWWDGESFRGIGNESNDDYWFEIDDLSLLNLCKILDYINEQN